MLEIIQIVFVILFVVMFVTVITIGLLQRKLTNNYQNVRRSRQLFYAMVTPVALWMSTGMLLLIVGLFS